MPIKVDQNRLSVAQVKLILLVFCVWVGCRMNRSEPKSTFGFAIFSKYLQWISLSAQVFVVRLSGK